MSDYIAHHGVKGQRWGVRKYVDENGNLTGLGKKKYAADSVDQKAKIASKQSRQEYKQQKALNEQAAKHEKARRKGRVAAVAALAVVGAMLAKSIMNNVRSNKIKLNKASTNNSIRLEKSRNLNEISLQKAKHDFPTVVQHLKDKTK